MKPITLAPHRGQTRRASPHAVLAVVAVFWGTLPLHAEEQKATAAAGTQRVPLSTGQRLALLLLNQARPEQPAPLFLFTDPNKDPDDLTVLVQTKYLQQQGFVDLRCVLTTLGDRDTRSKRARFARSVLDDLGLENAKVGVGVEYGFEVPGATGAVDQRATAGRQRDHNVFLETPLLRPLAAVEQDGLGLLKRELERAPDRSAVWLINAGMADAAAILREGPDLVRQKTAQVVIMGGAGPQVDGRGFVTADRRAYNNTTHQASADYVYARVQELGLPLVVVTREAAYAAAVPRRFYDSLAATRHPLGIYLHDQQRQSLAHLWTGIHRGHLPPALTPAWFFRTFTDVDPHSPAGQAALAAAEAHAEDFADIWKQVSKFNLYDPLALLAATPGAAELVFRRDVPAGARGHVQVLGKDSLKDAMLMKDLLAGLGLESLNPPLPRKSRTGTAPGYPPRQHVEEAEAPWTKPLPGYAPPEYTAAVVLQHAGEWADPANVKAVQRTFLTRTSRGEVAVPLDARGRPLNPLGRTGLQGRGLLGRWGRNQAGDPLLTRVHPETGRLQLLVIERKDSGQKALPGGMVDEGEEIAATVARELFEETGAKLSFAEATCVYTGLVDDPRNTDNAWMETTVLHKHLTAAEYSAMTLRAGDDARAVQWADLDHGLLSSMYASHGDYVRLALVGLKDNPAVARQVNELLQR